MREQKRARAEGLTPGKFVRFPRPVLKQVESIATSERRTVSNAIRILVEEGLKARGLRVA